MLRRLYSISSLLALSFSLISCATEESVQYGEVSILGQMKDTMWKGEIAGKIHLDTLADKAHLYGLGPVEYLRGEIMVLDGKAYKSSVVSDSAMLVEETFDLRAPFFAYTQVRDWEELAIPDSVSDLSRLEGYITQVSANSDQPFFFRLTGTVDSATIHIVNLPEGSSVSSPDEAHQGQRDYQLQDEPSEMVGFFSTSHQAIFTHHDTFMHIHLITADRQKMGHLDALALQPGAKLYLPLK